MSIILRFYFGDDVGGDLASHVRKPEITAWVLNDFVRDICESSQRMM
jgi:hypothetical protein